LAATAGAAIVGTVEGRFLFAILVKVLAILV
jgi:hypothetical protein